MDARIKKLWVEALRSGEYRQAKGALRYDGVGHCCLGVLCEIAAKEGVSKWSRSNVFDGCSGSIGSTVQDWAGLDGRDPTLSDGNSLVDLNDKMGVSFNQIADRIEAEL